MYMILYLYEEHGAIIFAVIEVTPPPTHPLTVFPWKIQRTECIYIYIYILIIVRLLMSGAVSEISPLLGNPALKPV